MAGFEGYPGYPGYGDPGSFAGSEGRRKIVAALLGKQRKYPTTIGEGIASVGENVGNVLYLNSLADEDKARGAYETNLGKGLPSIPVEGSALPSQRAEDDTQLPANATSAIGGQVPGGPSGNPAMDAALAEHRQNRDQDPTNPPPAPGTLGPSQWPSGKLQEYNGPPAAPGAFGQGPQAVDPGADARNRLTQTVIDTQGAAPPQIQTASLTPAFTGSGFPPPGAIPATPLPPVPGPPSEPPAPPAGAMAQAAPYANPPTMTDFRPMPNLGGIAGASTPPAFSAPPPAPARVLGPMVPPPAPIEKAPAALPSQEPVPPAPPPYVNPLKRPAPLGISPEQAKARAILSDPRINPNGALARQAQQVETYYEGIRKEKEAQQQADYVKAEQRAYEQPGKDLEERYKRGQIELQNATTPSARAKAEADLAKVQQEVAAGKAPETIKFENGKVGQWNQKTGAFTDITPQVNPLDIKMSESEGKKMEFYVRARGASDQLGNDASSLNNLGNALASRRLGLLGNYAVNPTFQKEYNLAKAWGQAVLRDESGAALSEKEVERKMDTYWPVPGDTPQTIASKSELRKNEERSFYLSLGGARPVADYYLERKTDHPDGTMLKDPSGQVRRVVKNGLWMDIPNGR